MNSLIILTALILLSLVVVVVFKPTFTVKNHTIESFWVVALVGAFLLVVFGFISWDEIWVGMTKNKAINPFFILILFFSMTLLSIVLDELGFFQKLASYAMEKAKGEQMKMFFYLYIITSVLTVFTSNDIIILTFTPFICYFAKYAKINPIPYLIAEFVAANSWSMMLIIGNPTNIYIASFYQIDFFSYLKIMFLPTIVTSVSLMILLLVIFHKPLEKEIDHSNDSVLNQIDVPLKNKTLTMIALIHLGLCTLLLSIASTIDWPMWLISLLFALSMVLVLFVYYLFNRKENYLFKVLKRLPFSLIPFVLSMFILVLTLNKYAITSNIAHLFAGHNAVYSYGITSFLSANLMNNIPMSVLFSDVIAFSDSSSKLGAIYASIIGSNLGAFFTPIGALAGVMWMQILKKEKISLSFTSFIHYGMMLSIPALLIALTVLFLVL